MASEEKSKRPIGLIELLGAIPGALSILGLIRDLEIANLYGLVLRWADAYSSVVRALMSWLHFPPFTVSQTEGHIIILSALVAAAVGRAQLISMKGENPSLFQRTWKLISSAGVFIMICLFAFFGDGPELEILCLVALTIFALVYTFMGTEDSSLPSYLVQRQLISVGTLFLILIGANYLYFGSA